jgi:hypothetical protein
MHQPAGLGFTLFKEQRPCNEEQQRQTARQTRNRVRSVLTQLVMQEKAPE